MCIRDSLFALGQLLIYWEDDAAAALPLLERAARYAVPMNAQPWMKRFAAESFLACAGPVSYTHLRVQ